MTKYTLSLRKTKKSMGYYDYKNNEILIFLPIHKSQNESLMIDEVLNTLKHEILHAEIYKASKGKSTKCEEKIVSKLSRAYKKKEVSIIV